jgi:hypothetical protein
MLFNIYSLSILTIRRKKQHFDLPVKALSLSPNVLENCPKPFLSSKQLQYFPLIKTCFEKLKFFGQMQRGPKATLASEQGIFTQQIFKIPKIPLLSSKQF